MAVADCPRQLAKIETVETIQGRSRLGWAERSACGWWIFLRKSRDSVIDIPHEKVAYPLEGCPLPGPGKLGFRGFSFASRAVVREGLGVPDIAPCAQRIERFGADTHIVMLGPITRAAIRVPALTPLGAELFHKPSGNYHFPCQRGLRELRRAGQGLQRRPINHLTCGGIV